MGNLAKGKGWNHVAAQSLFTDGRGEASFAVPCLKTTSVQKDKQNLHYSLKIQTNKTLKQKTKTNKKTSQMRKKFIEHNSGRYFYRENDHEDEYRKLKYTFSAEGGSH